MRIVHFEIPADDPARAMAFYQSAFGWSFDKWEGPMEDLDGQDRRGPGIDGGLMRRMAPGQAPTNVVAVPSVDDATRRIVAGRRHGGRAEDGGARRRLDRLLRRPRGQRLRRHANSDAAAA